MFRPPVKRLHVNLDQMCRLCLIESPDLVGIFDNTENCSLSIRIMACSALEVQPQDALPKTICIECRQMLERFYFFRKKSKNSDTKLRRHLRLINAGKTSQVFNVSDDDDEDEDDYVESRRLFERWDDEKAVEEAKAMEERSRREALAMQVARDEERERFRAEESARIAIELRDELEPEIREQVEQELRDTLEPLMRDQIEKQIEIAVKQRQVEQIKREVQEVLKSQKEELMNEYREMHKEAAAKLQAKPKSRTHKLEEELTSFMNTEQGGGEVGVGSDDNDVDKTVQDYVFYEVTEDQLETDDIKGAATIAMKRSPIYKVVDDSADEVEVEEEAGQDNDQISVHYQDEEESGQEEVSYIVEDDAESDVIIPNEEYFMVTDGASSEYLDEGEPVEDMEVLEDSESVLEEDIICNDDITDNLRKAIESNTGLRMQPDYKYKVRQGNSAKRTKVQVTNDQGADVAVCDLDEPNENLDENGELKIFQCDSCPEAFARRIQLARHLPTHENRRGHMCEFCQKWFPSKSSLVRHHRTHTGEKPFKCGVCDRSFIQKEILKRHEMVHTGERPFACTACDKTFTQREVLRQHFNRQHSECPVIDLHQCPKCPKSFLHASGLSRHILIHSGRKFPCDYCSKPFNDKSALKRHIASLHAERC